MPRYSTPAKKSVTVLVDSREKLPLRFPGTMILRPNNLLQSRNAYVVIFNVTTSVSCLSSVGCDYTIAGHEATTRIERKGSPEELYANLAGFDSARQSRSFDKLVTDCAHPILLLDFPMSQMWRSSATTGVDIDAALVMDRLLTTRRVYNLELYWTGIQSRRPTARRRIGEFALRLMLHHLADVT